MAKTREEAEKRAVSLTKVDGRARTIRNFGTIKSPRWSSELAASRKASNTRHSAQAVATGHARQSRQRYVNSHGGVAAVARQSHAGVKLRRQEAFSPAPELRHIVGNAHRVAVLSDFQIPYDDPAAVQVAFDTVQRITPDLIILNGDIVDCYAESDFRKDFNEAVDSIAVEHETLDNYLDILQSMAKVIYLGGNHESRWERLLWGKKTDAQMLMLSQHQKVTGRTELDLLNHAEGFSVLYGLKSRGIPYYPWHHRLYLADGNLMITHGEFAQRHAGTTARRTYEHFGVSCIVGHTHRMGTYLVSRDGVEHGAWEGGCLCQLEPKYVVSPDWHQGFTLVRIEEMFNVVPVHIVRSKPHSVPKAVFKGEL